MLYKNKTTNKKLLYFTIIAVLVAIGGVFALNYRHQHPQAGTTIVFPVKVPDSSTTNTPPNNGTSTQTPQTTSTKTTGTSSGTNTLLVAPYGSFVSNHSPSLGNGPSPSSEQSSCYTTTGAICYISFTKGSDIYKLPSQVADSNGIAYWSWDVKQTGMTQGVWKIQAVVALNGQTKSTLDPINLDIQP